MIPIDLADLDEMFPFPQMRCGPLGDHAMMMLACRMYVLARNTEYWLDELRRASSDPDVAERLNRPL